MKSIVTRLVAAVVTTGLLAACGNSAVLMQQRPVNQLNSFSNRAPQPNLRSNAGLDTIAKRMRVILFNQQDANRDGILHRHEVTFLPPELYTAVDKNKDGMWTIAEFQAFNFSNTSLAVPSRDYLRKHALGMWEFFNTDANAFVTVDELLKLTLGYGSGYGQPTTPAEQQNALAEATKMLNNADKNFDRKLNKSEFEDMYAAMMLTSMETPPLSPVPMPSATATSDIRR